MILQNVTDQLNALDASRDDYAQLFAQLILRSAETLGASDIHLQPVAKGVDICLRLDGVLQPAGVFPVGEKSDVVNRLKVLARLLTYRTDVPQEGRIRGGENEVEMRISTFPTLNGERAVVRLFANQSVFAYPEDLGYSPHVLRQIQQMLLATSGAFVVAGPAGSGKTTTCYACLRALQRDATFRRSIVSLEDPIEVALEGVAQSQVEGTDEFTLATGLRSLMRQDPEVILVGEMRDRETAEAVVQASLTGHLVLTTFHAGSAADAVNRLVDMGLEPYLLRSALLGVLSQRLLRRVCGCAQSDTTTDRLGLPLPDDAAIPRHVGCGDCQQTGYRGRTVVAELLSIQDGPIGKAIVERLDSRALEELAASRGMVTCLNSVCDAILAGTTTPHEARRVLGFSTTSI